MLIHSEEPTALNRDVGEEYAVFFVGIPWEGPDPPAKPAQEPEPRIYVFVDDRGYKGDEPWEQAAHARLMALQEKVVGLTARASCRSRRGRTVGLTPRKSLKIQPHSGITRRSSSSDTRTGSISRKSSRSRPTSTSWCSKPSAAKAG